MEFLGSDFGSWDEVLKTVSVYDHMAHIAVELDRYDGEDVMENLAIGDGDGVFAVNEKTKEIVPLGTGFTSTGDAAYHIGRQHYRGDRNDPHRICVVVGVKYAESRIPEILELLAEEWREQGHQKQLGEVLEKITKSGIVTEADFRYGIPTQMDDKSLLEYLRHKHTGD